MHIFFFFFNSIILFESIKMIKYLINFFYLFYILFQIFKIYRCRLPQIVPILPVYQPVQIFGKRFALRVIRQLHLQLIADAYLMV